MIILKFGEKQLKDIKTLKKGLPNLVKLSAKIDEIIGPLNAKVMKAELINTKNKLDRIIGSIEAFIRGDSKLPITFEKHFSYANDETSVAKQKLDLQVITEMMNDL